MTMISARTHDRRVALETALEHVDEANMAAHYAALPSGTDEHLVSAIHKLCAAVTILAEMLA